jgi:prepilin-type N-terminal cleavage/methylation domain-containing protein
MRSRKGFTLIEVMLVVAVLATSTIGLLMLAPSNALGSMQASSASRKLVAALRLCRSTAVANQADVRLRFLGSNRRPTGYVLESRVGPNFVPLTPTETLPDLAVVSSNANSIAFAPTGAADVSLVIILGTSRQRHQVSVVSGSGQIRYVKS